MRLLSPLLLALSIAQPPGPWGTTTGWREGEWLAFDETYVHRVWNETSEPRVVLFLQVLRPMRLAGRLAARVIQAGIRRTSFVQDVRRKLRAR